MKRRNSNTTLNNPSGDLGYALESDAAVYFILALVVLLSYGYEIFNFNLTIDEEIRANQVGMWFDWVAQGRWGMALMSYVLVPNPVAPVTSLFVGLLGFVLGVSFLMKSLFVLDRLGIAAITGLAVSIPTLAFSFTFSTIAYGIGVGFVALAGANWLLSQGALKSVVMASFLAGFAIGIYQTFVFVVAMIAVVHVWRAYTIENVDCFMSIRKPAIFIFFGVVLYGLINLFVLKSLNIDIKYVGQFIDIQGFVGNPIPRLVGSFQRWNEIISLSPNKFGIRSIWLGALVLASFAMVIAYPIYKRNIRSLVWMVTIAFAMICIVVMADAIAQGGAPLRSVIYVPVGIAIIVACAYTVSGKIGRYILLLLCGLTVIGNSQVNNHLFASSASAEFQDRMLAATIINEVRNIKPDYLSGLPIKIEVIGNHSWPTNGVLSKTETFGASFFEWDAGNRYRVAAYLSLNGLASLGASEEDRARIYQQGKSMLSWPHAGWIALKGDILVLKFGDYSSPQKASLCAQNITELCGVP